VSGYHAEPAIGDKPQSEAAAVCSEGRVVPGLTPMRLRLPTPHDRRAASPNAMRP